MENCKTLSALERIAKEQAAYYGKTPEQHAAFMQDMAGAQEIVEREDKKTAY